MALGEALDWHPGELATRSPKGWEVVNGDEAYDGEDALKLRLENRDLRGGIRVPLVGTGLVRLAARSEGEAAMSLSPTSGVPRQLSITPDWKVHEFRRGPGQELYLGSAQATSFQGEATVWLDTLSIEEEVSAPSLAVATGIPGATFTTSSGDAAWHGRAFDSRSFAQAGAGSVAEPSWLETSASGPGMVKFEWLGGSPTYTEFLVDGIGRSFGLASRRACDPQSQGVGSGEW